ncbi:MAG: 30S ribosomal protein S1 [Leptospiraceae bacterium]|nr:MAG: 30S ribosomal protein S1 [Leptospiraceae bacterium]
MKSKQIGQDKINTELAKLYLKTLETPKQFELGEQVYVVIKDIKDPEYIFIESDIGTGLIPKEQVLNEEGEITVNVGETIPAFYIGSKNGDHYFTIVPIGNYAKLIIENAKINKIPLKGKIETILESGYQVKIGDVVAFCPKSKLPKQVNKGETLPFIVIDQNKNSFVVSYLDYLQLQKEQLRKELIEKLRVDSVITGKVKNLIKQGAIIDLGYGLEAFVPISEISYKRIEHPSDVLKVGNEIRAKVKEIDWKEDRIILSIKELEKNPWLGTLPFNKGDVLDVKILQILKTGLIVQLPEKFHGFIPIKELNLTKQKQLHKEFQKDQILKAMIIQIDKEKQRILLSIKAAQEYFEQIEYKKYIKNTQEDDSVSLGSILFND